MEIGKKPLSIVVWKPNSCKRYLPKTWEEVRFLVMTMLGPEFNISVKRQFGPVISLLIEGKDAKITVKLVNEYTVRTWGFRNFDVLLGNSSVDVGTFVANLLNIGNRTRVSSLTFDSRDEQELKLFHRLAESDLTLTRQKGGKIWVYPKSGGCCSLRAYFGSM